LARLARLKTLKLYWTGRMLISNPWSFDYCLDRQEQKVDNLFNRGSLDVLEDLDLSGFYQTVDSNVVQLMCEVHLSSACTMNKHLKNVNLSHCYQARSSTNIYQDFVNCANF
jgi:Ran GTPase-activating protein (RanGAP) involved in mRNA processing and transport